MLIVIAEKEELKLVKELDMENNPILITGVGGINVYNSLKNIPRETEIVNIGYCGSHNIDVGDIVSVNYVGCYSLLDKKPSLNTLDLDSKYCFSYNKAVCYTATNFVTKAMEEDKPCVYDMELAFIKTMGFEFVSSIKKVSDKLNYNKYKKEIKNV